MIRVQAITRDRSSLKSVLRAAIASGQIRAFTVSNVKGGLRIKHQKHIGTISVAEKDGVLLASISCKNAEKEWQILESFVGRLAYHFRNVLASINVQFDGQ